MHLTRAIPYIALTLFARKSSRKCHTVRTFGLTAVTEAKEEKDDRKNKKEEEEEEEEEAKEIAEKRVEREREIVSGRYAKNLKLSRVSRQARKRETDAVTTGPRETENAPRRV
ncbi:hypothetical protein ALC56_03868 [Trachymyrmex septentrionalis]|uniref:Uncharacterized protein n=1 Tax=Trachymyrmex septentrionalis TaxID=34720 RepID=A0A195FM01_9HYME|nr:hypothetical protein ALC56_03868 [Trachymyrmex septentrionalis]